MSRNERLRILPSLPVEEKKPPSEGESRAIDVPTLGYGVYTKAFSFRRPNGEWQACVLKDNFTNWEAELKREVQPFSEIRRYRKATIDISSSMKRAPFDRCGFGYDYASAYLDFYSEKFYTANYSSTGKLEYLGLFLPEIGYIGLNPLKDRVLNADSKPCGTISEIKNQKVSLLVPPPSLKEIRVQRSLLSVLEIGHNLACRMVGGPSTERRELWVSVPLSIDFKEDGKPLINEGEQWVEVIGRFLEKVELAYTPSDL